MKAKEFMEEYTKRVYSLQGVVNKYWKADYSEFTDLIISRVIDPIIQYVGWYNLSHEYFRIDASGWTSRSDEIEAEAKELELIPHKWDLKIAVEHENDRRDWTDEAAKLMHVRCPLKVVIGYTDSRYRDGNPKSDAAKVSRVKQWMQGLDAVKQMPADEEFLIILGNAVKRPDASDPEKSIDYRGYVMQKDPETQELEITRC